MSERLDGLLAPLPVGTLAPDFSLPHMPLAHVALHGLRGSPIVLVFYPMDWEPVSREQLRLYQDFGDDFAGFGAHVLGISTDHVYSHEAFARDAQIRFPLLADVEPRGACARQYGVYRTSRGVSARATFVLDRQGVVRFGKAYPDLLNPGVDELLTTLETLAQEQKRQ
ncbi:MAG TPA: peroxiredoxin family protein [Ktedonobacterales bacterium]|nr:peroxiredoxin family protein [Ktedonobacterales bacterium]